MTISEQLGLTTTRTFRNVAIAVACLTIMGCPVFITVPIGSNSPGLNIAVLAVDIPADRIPRVTFTAMDDKDNLLPLNELTDARFILAVLESPTDGSTPRFASYSTTIEDPDDVPNSGDEATQATYDSARLGGVTTNDNGTLTYTFATALPAGFDAAATHQLAGQFRRFFVLDGQDYRANLAYRFRPDGRDVVDTREFVSTEACNGCHTRLGLHGGARREIQLCITCHNPGSTDANSGNTVDFPVLIHKIHRGVDLPSGPEDPFQIYGFRDTLHDFSEVVFPQDVRNCTACHTGAPGADVYATTPTLSGCTSCHDRTWFGNLDQTPEGWDNHVGGMHDDSRLCATCHAIVPIGNGVAPIDVVHVLPTESDAAPGLSLEIIEVATSVGTKGDDDTRLEITILALDGAGNPIADMEVLDTVATTVAWPVPEYQTFIRETVNNTRGDPTGTVINEGDGVYTYIFDAGLPTGSTDTFAVAMEGRRKFEFRGDTLNQGTSTNGQMLFRLDGGDIATRRQIVSIEKCNVCHYDKRQHGDLRTGIELCVMCHNPNTSDIGRRPEEDFPPESVHFKTLIHQIHTGEELNTEFTVYGFSGGDDFTEILFPGDRRDCSICHVNGSTELPLSSVAAPTVVADGEEILSTVLPERAACTSCHDGALSNVHALLATDLDSGVETCAICHGPGADFDVARVHAIEP